MKTRAQARQRALARQGRGTGSNCAPGKREAKEIAWRDDTTCQPPSRPSQSRWQYGRLCGVASVNLAIVAQSVLRPQLTGPGFVME